MPALHVVLGPQTSTKLEEIAQVTEESKTALVHRLIREEWERQRALYTNQPVKVDVDITRFNPPSPADRDRVFVAGGPVHGPITVDGH